MKKYCGIQMMISKGYFEDAFILHDESSHRLHVNEILSYIKKAELSENSKTALIACKSSRTSLHQDHRLNLHKCWAKLRNIFKYQPLRLIRYLLIKIQS